MTKTNQRRMYRQGDIMLVKCKTIPGKACPVAVEGGRLIVARGEATGHHHSFSHRAGAFYHPLVET